MSRSSRLVLAFLVSTTATAWPQQPAIRAPITRPPPRVTNAAKREGPIKIDGELDEPAWRAAPVTSRFVQSYPIPNAPATDPTEVRVLYDDDAMYVGVRLFDAHPDSIASQLMRRDATGGIYSDWLHVMIDTYHDRRSAFRFSVNPRGVKYDAREYNDNSEDVNWDAVWDVATAIDAKGWSAELRIPFSQLRFSTVADTVARVWGFQVMRDVARRNERDTWAPWSPQDGALVSRFGDLDDLIGVPSPIHTELLPYLSSRLTEAPPEMGNPFFRSNDTKPSAGADFKVGLPKGLTLTGAINPDFGQVEVDPAVVNLSAFETFFPEKRPFFVEGAGIFSFGQTRTYNNYEFQQYFYTRRIGRPPTRSIDAPYVDAPDATTIAGAAKLSGRVGPWTVGVLNALTSEEDARYRTAANGPTRHAAVEPTSNYFVGRARRDFDDGHTVVGTMLTATHRQLGDTAFTSLLRDRALFGGIDFEHSWARGGWWLTGYAAGTQVNGAPGVIAATQRSSTHYYQRPDAAYLRYDTTRTSLAGATSEIAIQKTGAWVGSLSFKTVTPGLELNDLGFQGRSDYRALSSLFGYQSYAAGKRLQNFSAYTFANQTWNYGGTLLFNAWSVGGSATFHDFWSVNGNAGWSPSVESDRLTRGGPLARVPDNVHTNLTVTSDWRKPLSGSGSLFAERDGFDGGYVVQPGLSLTIRPISFVTVAVGPSMTKQRTSNQYIQTVDDAAATATFGHRYVFAELDQTTLSANTRINWTFTPALSLELYAQPFVSAGRYSRFKELRRASSAAYTVYGETQGTIDADSAGYTVDPDGSGGARPFEISNPDFNVRSLRGDAVMRWEYRPGSTLYIVWQQQRSGSEGFGDFDFGRDVGAIFREPVTNVFLVKLTYWVGT